MADNTALYGFRFHSFPSGRPLPTPVPMRVASGYQASPGGTNCDLNVGDPVKYVSDGTVAMCSTSDPTFGVVVGIREYYDGAKMAISNKLPGNTVYGTVLERTSWVMVQPAAGVIWEISADDNTTATTESAYVALINENMDVSTNADATLKQARFLADISTHSVPGTSLNIRLVGVGGQHWARVNIDYTGNYVPLLVMFNEVQEAPYNSTGV